MDTKAHESRQDEANAGRASDCVDSTGSAGLWPATRSKAGETPARPPSSAQDSATAELGAGTPSSRPPGESSGPALPHRALVGRSAAPRRRLAAFTLIEVLASLLFMAIVIPVVMQGVSVASRAGIMGQRKAAAIRVAERMLDEIVVTGETNQANASGTITEGDASYNWSMESLPWSEDSMTEMTVKVTFTVQGEEFSVSATTLYDPTMAGMTPDSQ